MQTKTLAVGLALVVSIAGAETRTATVEDPRPLAKALESLETFYGVPITYEDPPYVNAGEIADASDQVRGGHSAGRPILVPRGGSISFAYEAFEPALAHDAVRLAAAAAVRGILANYQTAGGARFVIVPGTITLHVAPAQFTDQAGKVQSLNPLLDTSVSLSAEPRTAGKFVYDLCDALSRASGQTVILGAIPYNLLLTKQTSLTVSNVAARVALDQLFSEIHALLSWQLFHDPGLNWYVLNIHLVHRPAKEQ